MSTSENSNPTQCMRVIKYMNEHGSINQYQAFFELGIMRLASRISDIKKNHNIPIQKQMVTVRNRFDEKCRVAEYRFGSVEDEEDS